MKESFLAKFTQSLDEFVDLSGIEKEFTIYNDDELAKLVPDSAWGLPRIITPVADRTGVQNNSLLILFEYDIDEDIGEYYRAMVFYKIECTHKVVMRSIVESTAITLLFSNDTIENDFVKELSTEEGIGNIRTMLHYGYVMLSSALTTKESTKQ